MFVKFRLYIIILVAKYVLKIANKHDKIRILPFSDVLKIFWYDSK